MPDYYQLLGISSTASKEEIKTAYKKLAFQLHPDKNPGDMSAEETFKQVNEAYQVLSNDGKRAHYDLKQAFSAQETLYTYPEFNSNTEPENERPYRRPSYHYSGRPRYAPRVELEPAYERKMYIVFGFIILALIAGGIWFHQFMNRWNAEQYYQEAVAEGKTYSAMLKYSEAIGFDKEFWQAYYKRGELRISILGDYRHAYYDFNAAIHYTDKSTSAMYYNRGLCSLQLNNYAEALTDFTQAIQLNQRNGNAYYLRSLTYVQLKDHENACQDWKKAASLGVRYSEDSPAAFCP